MGEEMNLIRYGFLIAVMTAIAFPVCAKDTIRFGKAFPTVFQFTPVELGVEKGIFEQLGLDVEIQGFFGDAKLQQAFAAGVVDIGIGSGAALGFIAKGSPVLGVAEAAGPPLGITLSVLKDAPYKTIADLKGKIISGSSVGDQTEWMVRKLSILQGWGPDGFRYVGLGPSEAQISALVTHEVAANTMDLTTAATLQAQGKTRIFLKFGDVITDYVNHVIFASTEMTSQRPANVRAFLSGWFLSVAYFKTHKAEAVSVAARILNKPEDIVALVYDDAVPMLTNDGHFDLKGLEVVGESLVETKIVSTPPDMKKLITETFLTDVPK
jgi:NitT/TauT family transport system substrate-binding protein